ncbi:MAG: TIGR04348 family glycosyltransferase [Planctomycetes bacterium]|nr:TIGR04348 family glycosyltransferase [Planctomycetota bacterium]MCB9886664.1 TIGR04348 family glycosyltransferase [Planctomycetota bacterium]
MRNGTVLNAVLVTPAGPRSRSGNRVTALRWAALLRRLGVHTRVVEQWRGEPCELLVAVHAVKSRDSVLACAQARPATKLVVLLAGTDIYPQFHPDAATLAALTRADAIVTLQPQATQVLPEPLRRKARTIVQSAVVAPRPRPTDRFAACVLAHLRPVKDPLLPFAALRHVPAEVPIHVTVAGRAMSPDLKAAADAAVAADPRAHWCGELSRRDALRLLASSHACLVPSTAEGGANVVSEAIAAGTPVIATDIPGNTGLLGTDWPALFAAGDTAALGAILLRCATDSAYYQELVRRTLALQHLVDPAREQAQWRALLDDLGLTG